MDHIFGTSGVADADRIRMEQINEEIGLNRVLRGEASAGDVYSEKGATHHDDEKYA